MTYVFRLRTELSETTKKAFEDAKRLVLRFEQHHPCNPNRVMSEIMRAQQAIQLGRHPTADDVYKWSVTELAARFAGVSNGLGGVDPHASKQSLRAMQNALEGKDSNGQPLRSQVLARLIASP